jgi:hypothetical protein
MPSPFRRSLPIAGVAVVITAALARADAAAPPAPHVRPETAETRELLVELTARSATARAIIGRIEHADLVVYVRHRQFTDLTLDGRTGFVQSDRPTRYLILELACTRTHVEQLVALGHELQHAAEIAAAPEVAGVRTLAALYRRIGVRTNATAEAATFETEAAQNVSMQVRQELSGRTVRTTHERH